jgi:hypothetical protein
MDRKPDPALCIPPGVDPVAAERALGLIVDGFGIPSIQRHCLRPDDELLALYRSFTPPGWPDCMEFETLHLFIERSLGRPLSEAEWQGVRSVGDVVRLVAGGPEAEPVAAPDRGRTTAFPDS